MSRCTVAGSCRFLSTLSLRRATGAEIQDPGQVLFLSTLSLRRATLSKDAKDGPVLISLHALLTESDAKLTQKFEIRSKFLSTLSLRRATLKTPCVKLSIDVFLSTLSLRRATVHYDNYNLHCVISIHALLTESDQRRQNSLNRSHNFYPRSPYGERPPVRDVIQWEGIFLSTLSLRRATHYTEKQNQP